MAKYTTKKCPYCGRAYQILQMGDQRDYGCPLKICERCKKVFFDSDIKEPALYGYNNAYEKYRIVRNFIIIIVHLMASIGCIYLGIETDYPIIFLIPLFNIIVIVIYLIKLLDEKRNKEDIIEHQRIEWDESYDRLKNTEYLEALSKFDNKAGILLQQRQSGEEEKYAERP